MHYGSQGRRLPAGAGPGVGRALIVPNPKLKLLDEVREVMRLKHCSRPGRGNELRTLNIELPTLIRSFVSSIQRARDRRS